MPFTPAAALKVQVRSMSGGSESLAVSSTVASSNASARPDGIHQAGGNLNLKPEFKSAGAGPTGHCGQWPDDRKCQWGQPLGLPVRLELALLVGALAG